MSLARRKDFAMLAFGVLVVLIDQLTKGWIVSYFAGGHPPIHVLGDVLELQFLPNTGVAFSLFEGDGIKFILIAIALAVVCYLYWQARETGTLLLKVSFGLILGGAVSNLADRFTRQYVVDFIHFQIPRVFDWPVFNVADSAISVGVILLAIQLWITYSHEEAEEASAAASAPSATARTSEPPRMGSALTARMAGLRARRLGSGAPGASANTRTGARVNTPLVQRGRASTDVPAVASATADEAGATSAARGAFHDSPTGSDDGEH